MKNRIVSISLAVILALSVILIGCGGEQVPEYSLTISSTEGGTVTTPGEGTGSFTYNEGTVVDLVAVAEEDYHFVKWTGDVDTVGDVNAAATTIIMNGDYEITANFQETPTITFAVVGPMTEVQGKHQWWGAELARDEINAGAGVNVGGIYHKIELIQVDTEELTEGEDGSSGATNLEAVIDDVGFLVGGFRTEVVNVYREVAMNAKKIFMNCGAATASLQFSVVTNYDKYKYWFKVAPYNETFFAKSVFKINRTVAGVLKSTLAALDTASNGTYVKTEFKVPADGKLRVHILMEDAAWCAGMVVAAQIYLPILGYTVTGTTLVSATATDITTEMNAIKDKNPHIIFTAFSGPVGAVYSTTKVDLRIPAMTIGINLPGQLKSYWTDTDGKCNGEIMLDTWAEGLQNTAKSAAFFHAFMARTGEYPYFTAATYDAIYQLKAAIEATDSLDTDDIIPYLETHSFTGVGGPHACYPMPAITVAAGQLYALSEAQVKSWYPDIDNPWLRITMTAPYYTSTAGYTQSDWMVGFVSSVQQPHIAHDLVFGPGYATGIGSQWQDGHKVGVWPMDLGRDSDAALTDQYGCWNFEYPGTVDVVIPIEGFLAS